MGTMGIGLIHRNHHVAPYACRRMRRAPSPSASGGPFLLQHAA
jgi:hypothetical protein